MSQTIKDYLFGLCGKLKNSINPDKYPILMNVNRVDETKYRKRALLIYIVRAFNNWNDSSGHQNRRQSRHIVKLLDELGYVVDVVDIRDRRFLPTVNYDLVICNRVTDTPLKKDAVRIYLATTLYHKNHNDNILKRHERLMTRRGCKLEPRRLLPETMPYVMKSDAILGFGNEYIMKSWREVFKVPIYQFNNYGFIETAFKPDSKDFSAARRNFLFFASGSQMQKGLDLLLEIFPKHPGFHLYICSDFEKEPDFCDCYHQELYETSNIHPVGRIRVNGPEYNELVQKCAFVIAPSCSEGQSGSVVQCMYSGLIPLVTKEAGIDTEDFGITFADDSLEETERVILEVSELPESWHMKHSLRTRRVSEKKYSEEAFIHRWRYILGEILKISGKYMSGVKGTANGIPAE
jgi:glycosyltransferase involved in cell wall biosynthesis